jgi:hypothetical protein
MSTFITFVNAMLNSPASPEVLYCQSLNPARKYLSELYSLFEIDKELRKMVDHSVSKGQ